MQHRGLAAAGIALHADDEVVREQHRPDRLLLAPGQAGPVEPLLHRLPVRQRHALPAPRPHRGQHAAFGLHRPVGDEGPVHAPALDLDQLAAPDQALDRRVDLGQRVPPRRMAQRHRPDLRLRQHRPPLTGMRYRPRHRFQYPELGLPRQLRPAGRTKQFPVHPGQALGPIPRQPRQRRRALHAPDRVGRQVGRRNAGRAHPLPGQRVDGAGRGERRLLPAQPQRPRLRAPLRHQLRETPVLLPPPRVQRRHLRELRRVGQAQAFQVLQDRPAPAREGIEERALVTRKLEPRYRPHHARRHRHAERLKAPRQLVPIIRSDQLLAAADLRRLHAAPLARRIPRHVGQHAVGVELRVLIAAREMPEPRHHHAVGLDPGAPARRRVPAPGLQKLRLHPVERLAHRLVMRPDHPAVADRQRLERYRLGRREGDVPARPVLVPALTHPSEIDVGPRNPAGQHVLEERRPHMRVQAQRLSRLAVPEARLAVLRVVPGVIPVALVIHHRDGGGLELEDRGDHAARPSERQLALARLGLVRLRRIATLRRIGTLRLTGVLRRARGRWLAARLFILRRSGRCLAGRLFIPRRGGRWLAGRLFIPRRSGRWLAGRLFIPRRCGQWLAARLFLPRRSRRWLAGRLFILRRSGRCLADCFFIPRRSRRFLPQQRAQLPHPFQELALLLRRERRERLLTV